MREHKYRDYITLHYIKDTHTRIQAQGAGADPRLQAVSVQVTACIVMNPAVGCHHLPPGSQRHTHAYS